jgi:hypothetical protein
MRQRSEVIVEVTYSGDIVLHGFGSVSLLVGPWTSCFTVQATRPNKHNSLLCYPCVDFRTSTVMPHSRSTSVFFLPDVSTSVGYASRLQNAPVCRTNDDGVIAGAGPQFFVDHRALWWLSR